MYSGGAAACMQTHTHVRGGRREKEKEDRRDRGREGEDGNSRQRREGAGGDLK